MGSFSLLGEKRHILTVIVFDNEAVRGIIMKKLIFSVLGGDARQCSLAERLMREGGEVCCYGLPREKMHKDINVFSSWQEALVDVDVVILPLPASPDGVRVHMPLAQGEEVPLLKEIFARIPTGTFLAGGRFSPCVKALAEEYGHVLFDYAESEEFKKQNALPTAEGAVQILMERMSRTVSGLSVAITGYGRVAKALARLLHAMGAHVTIGARKPMALAEAACEGYAILRLKGDKSVMTLCEGQAVIFNTVPHWLFNKEVLRTIPKETPLIDLASAPGGIDVDAAGALGLSVIWALALPGKYAPVTAGEIIADTVLSQMRREDLL